MQGLSRLEEAVAPWHGLRRRLEDLAVLAELAGAEDDPDAYAAELERELATARPRKGSARPHVNTLLERASGQPATARAWATLRRIAADR